MEDLGTISINIKDSGGGGSSASGSIGGGLLSLRPAAINERGLIRINQAVIQIAQASLQGMKQGGGGSGVGSATPPPPPAASPMPPAAQSFWTRLQSKLGMVETGSSIKGELGGFLRNPSAGGMASLLSSSASTGKAIGMLGAAAVPVAAVLGVVLISAVAGIAAYKLLQSSAEKISRKFDEITRFSGAMMFAKANERLAQFTRQVADAAKNSTAYARAQSFATMASDAQAQTMLHFDAASAELAAVWHRLSIIVYKALKPLAEFAEWLSKAVNWGNAILLAFSAIGGIAGIAIFPLVKSIYDKTAQIQRNTQPQRANAINDWFQADIQAVTGVRYDNLGGRRRVP